MQYEGRSTIQNKFRVLINNATEPSAVQLAPSIVARGEWNAMANLAHPDAAHIAVMAPQAVIRDARLFTEAAGPAA